MATIDAHVRYLMSVAERTSDESKSEPSSIRSMYVELNRASGMYWIVCSYVLLARMYDTIDPAVLTRLRDRVHSIHILDQQDDIVVDESGGLLRALSQVQLIHLLNANRDDRIELTSRVSKSVLSFAAGHFSDDSPLPVWFDIRSLYCVLAVLKLTDALDTVSPGTVDRMVRYVESAQSVLGGFGAGPRAEAHAGYTFCAVSTLRILGRDIPRRSSLIAWLRKRMNQCNGRPGKPRDSCYLWWTSAALTSIGDSDYVQENKDSILRFLCGHCECYGTGGYSKFPSVPVEGDSTSVHGKQSPDLFHTFLAIATQALLAGHIDPLTVLPVALS